MNSMGQEFSDDISGQDLSSHQGGCAKDAALDGSQDTSTTASSFRLSDDPSSVDKLLPTESPDDKTSVSSAWIEKNAKCEICL